MPPYTRVGVTVKSDLDHRDEVVQAVLKILRAAGVDICIDAKRADTIPGSKDCDRYETGKDIDLLLVVGGDGTILRAVREMQSFSTPILSINRGAVGFLAEMSMDEAPTLLPRFLRGEGIKDERSVIHVSAHRGDEELVKGFVLNEAVISQGSIARLIDLRTTVNGEELTTFRADGLIVATPTGSTAYTLAAGGPIVHPHLPAMILTPVNSHSFSQKPIVVPGTHDVLVEVLAKKTKFGDTEVTLTLDGQTFVRLHRHDTIRAHVPKQKVTFLRRKAETFYGTLREKLKWGERPED